MPVAAWLAYLQEGCKNENMFMFSRPTGSNYKFIERIK